ncbi:hypothetical protein FHS29_000188 [Saccharothrix tamanrassetensis]|uniref:SWIM-type domain-containing protein n=1 Tax=Saccharothrix tamanrassetensis TaxID=1051531 RepID=A0A841CBS3_9PSEU|nr:hypothetical protein [Saccharothrix tamanrassetensis]MBB5953618.1 hypothetical protein [Saccharothrix tamanrassetensis]
MTRTTLPPVAPAVVADVLDALPPRLRKRIDASLDRAETWEVTIDGGTARAELDADTALTWTLHGGVLTAADDLTCSCLLAPRCLHRGIAAAAAPIADPAGPDLTAPDPAAPDSSAPGSAAPDSTTDGLAAGEPTADTPAAANSTSGDSAGTAGTAGRPAAGVTLPTTDPLSDPPTGVRANERAAATSLWEAGTTVLRAGATGSGAVARAELLRAVHTARVAGLHRAAAGGLRIASALTAARTGDSSFDRETLTAELVDLLLLCHDLRTATEATTELRGTARREYRPIGALRLYGLCTEPVLTTSGYGGVVTHLVDDSGVLWTVPAIMPGGPERITAAADGPVAIGESGLTHRRLGRGGLLLSGGTASPDHRLGAGKSVRAVAASGTGWDASPLTDLWARPLGDQLARAFEAGTRPDTHRPAGADLLFLAGTVQGPAGNALRLAADTGHLDLIGEGERARENLRVLARAGGLELRVVARLVPDRPGTALALAVSGDLALPADLHHHVDLGLDRLQRSHVEGRSTADLPPRPAPTDRVPPPLRPLENVLHRVTLGGRAVVAASSASREVHSLSGNGLTATADLLADLAAACRDRERDAFGRVVRDAGDAFPVAWLRAGLHVREFTHAVARRAWLDAVSPM